MHSRQADGWLSGSDTMTLFFYRMMGAAMLDGGMYEGIEHDRTVTWQAAAVVLLSSLAAGLCAGAWYGGSLQIFVFFSTVALVTWVAWAVMMFHIGTRLLPGRDTDATLGELLRTTGFAASPGVLQVFGVFPGMAWPVSIVTWLWMFAAMVVGVRHALDYSSTGRALAVCGLAATLALTLAIVSGVLFGPTLH
jgi:hypothetical protein